MDKRSLDLLERAFSAQISAAIDGGPGLIQTRSKLAKKLEADGCLEKVTVVLGGRFPVSVEGYQLTLLGNMAYCTSDRCAAEHEMTA